MRARLIVLLVSTALLSLAACGLETKPADPNALLPPGDRPPPGPGLFSGEDGVYKIIID